MLSRIFSTRCARCGVRLSALFERSEGGALSLVSDTPYHLFRRYHNVAILQETATLHVFHNGRARSRYL
jgi:hypothetical protein